MSIAGLMKEMSTPFFDMVKELGVHNAKVVAGFGRASNFSSHDSILQAQRLGPRRLHL